GFWRYHRGPIGGQQSKCRVRLPCQPTGSTFARPYFGAISTNAWSAENPAALPNWTCITFSRVQPETGRAVEPHHLVRRLPRCPSSKARRTISPPSNGKVGC